MLAGVALMIILVPARVAGQQPSSPAAADSAPRLTLDEVLRAARAANAQLPLSSLGVNVARTQVREAQASRWPTLSMESAANLGGPLAYTTPQGQLQLAASAPLYTGGLQRATIRAAQFQVQAASAGFRITEKDVDLDVRLRFSALLREAEEIALRQQGIDRLRGYLAQVEARRLAGQPVGSDVLTTSVRLGAEEAMLADAERARDEARFALNDLMGRDPRSPLALAELPPPTPPATPADSSPWISVPELRQAGASRGAAEAEIAAARSERRPQLFVSGNAGALPLFASTNPGTGPNGGTGLGAAVVFSFSLPFLDAGGYAARVERAEVQAEQARDSEIVVFRQARLAWTLADAQQAQLYAQVTTWARTVPLARDAYLQTASMYNGGAATALEVLDAYSAWINASVSYADAVLLYRQAEATALRWGTP